MNVDRIMTAMNEREVESLLIGGMNFLLRHRPVLTFDVDLWIRDTPENRARCESALVDLDAEWGRGEEDWGPVARLPRGWLATQSMYCLHSPRGAIDIFRAVTGLPSWEACARRAISGTTAGGAGYLGLCDADMLACQTCLPPGERKAERIAALRSALNLETPE